MIRIGNKLQFVDPMFLEMFGDVWWSWSWNLLVILFARLQHAHHHPSIDEVLGTLPIPIIKPPSSNLFLLQVLTFVNTEALYGSFVPQEWLMSFFYDLRIPPLRFDYKKALIWRAAFLEWVRDPNKFGRRNGLIVAMQTHIVGKTKNEHEMNE